MSVAPRIGLVLGAGGTSGGFFIRAGFAALQERTGWVPAMSQMVIGTSVGALNAARIDSEAIEATDDSFERLRHLSVELGVPSRTIADRGLHAPRRVGGRLLGRLAPAGKHQPDYDVAAPPFHPQVRVVSCRRSDGSRRVSILANAAEPSKELYASAAIPGYSPPVEIDGEAYVDGAVWSTTNADLVDPVGLDLLIVIAPMVPLTGGSLLRRAHRASLLNELAPWKRSNKPIVYLVPRTDAMDNKDDHQAFGADARRQILG